MPSPIGGKARRGRRPLGPRPHRHRRRPACRRAWPPAPQDRRDPRPLRALGDRRHADPAAHPGHPQPLRRGDHQLRGILAAAGVAIGMAWSGLLSNFAAGVFLMVLRPFKVGDFVTIAGITGTVKEIGLFSSSLDTPGQHPHLHRQRQDLRRHQPELHHQPVPPRRAQGPARPLRRRHGRHHKLRERLPKIPHVMKDPAPAVELLEFTAMGPRPRRPPLLPQRPLLGRVLRHHEAIVEVGAQSGFAVPEQHYHLRRAS